MADTAPPDPERVVAETRAWIEKCVVGLELCPFAAQPLREGRVRFYVSDAGTPEVLASELSEELRRLDGEPVEKLETTLLMHPGVLQGFEQYNSFLDVADLLLEQLGLVGEIQIASFHPGYRFAGTAADDVVNATNRSPFPMLHLLREESVARAVAQHPDVAGIPARNVERLRALGAPGLERLLGPRVRPRGRPPA